MLLSQWKFIKNGVLAKYWWIELLPTRHQHKKNTGPNPTLLHRKKIFLSVTYVKKHPLTNKFLEKTIKPCASLARP